MAGKKPRRYESNPEREVDEPALSVVEPLNDRFAAAADYYDYRLLKKSSNYDGDVTHKLHKMARKI